MVALSDLLCYCCYYIQHHLCRQPVCSVACRTNGVIQQYGHDPLHDNFTRVHHFRQSMDGYSSLTFPTSEHLLPRVQPRILREQRRMDIHCKDACFRPFREKVLRDNPRAAVSDDIPVLFPRCTSLCHCGADDGSVVVRPQGLCDCTLRINGYQEYRHGSVCDLSARLLAPPGCIPRLSVSRH